MFSVPPVVSDKISGVLSLVNSGGIGEFREVFVSVGEENPCFGEISLRDGVAKVNLNLFSQLSNASPVKSA